MSDKLSVIRKLLAKAERAGTEAEAAAFTAKATELMLKHQIDEAMLAPENSTDTLGFKRFTLTGGYSKPKGTLLNVLSIALGCKAVRLTNREVIEVFGWESDLQALEVLFASLLIQAEREHDRERPKFPGVNGRTFKTSFLVGFANTVSQRLAQAKRKTMREAESSTPGAELALFDRSKAVSREFRQAHPRTTTATGSQVSSRGGFYAGQEAGRRADLGQGGLGGRRVAIAH